VTSPQRELAGHGYEEPITDDDAARRRERHADGSTDQGSMRPAQADFFKRSENRTLPTSQAGTAN